MSGLLPPLLQRLRRRLRPEAAATPAPAAPPDATAERRMSDRALADAIDRAMVMGLSEHADRIARTAERVEPKSSRLLEGLARLRLAQGRPEAALALIESRWSGTDAPSSVRGLRAACLVRAGRRDRAHADLHRWSRRAAAPLDARRMLALLEWDAGDEHAATLALLRNLRQIEDPRSLELLVLLAVAQSRHEQAARWAARLADVAVFDLSFPCTDILPLSVGMDVPRPAAEPTREQVAMLAAELKAAEEVIPALAEAQRRRPQPALARLLARAIAEARPELTDAPAAVAALARLALVAGDAAEARRWIAEGTAQTPRSIELARLERELEDAATTADGAAAPPTPARPDVIGRIGGDRPDPRSTGDDLAQEKAA